MASGSLRWASSSARSRRPPQFLNAQFIVDASYRLLAPPRITIALDREQIVRRSRVAAMRDRRCRGHADCGYRALRPVDPYRRMNVVMPVQDQFHAVLLQ